MDTFPANSLRIGMALVPDFNVMATMGFIDPLRAANYLDGRNRFRWRFLSDGGGPCRASNGAEIVTEPLSGASGRDFDILLVSASWAPERHATIRLQRLLRDAARQGAMIAALDTGAFILARCGLLQDCRASVHYQHIDAFQELFPDVEVGENLFEIGRNRMTCCGGSAAVELGLHLVHSLHGRALANAAARYIFHPTLREPGTRQQPERREPLGSLVPARVKTAIQLMEDNLEEPLPIPALCQRVGISHRQLDRLFATHIRKTPTLYYRDIRLDRARGLVTQTEMSMSEIAVASGFTGQVHFSRAYSDRFGLPPIRDRVEGRVPFEFRAWPTP